jgi:cell division inhibitor SulA
MNPALNTVLQHPAVWRGDRLAQGERTGLPSGFSALDKVLPGGGWPVGALTEILHEAQGLGELSLLMPTIVAQTQQARGVVLINPPHWLYAPAWAAQGVNLSQCLVVRPERANDVLWTAEQSLRAGACALVLVWPEFQNYKPDYRVLRRLQTAAETGQSSGMIFRSSAVANEASPAPLRLQLTAADGALNVRILKRRGALLQEAVPIGVRALLAPASTPQTTISRAPVETRINGIARARGATSSATALQSTAPQPQIYLVSH